MSVRLVCLAALLLLDGDPFAEGMRAYGEGRFADALAAFTAAAEALGEDAPAELHFDRALAALRAGDLAAAEAAANAIPAGADRDVVLRRDFVRANLAFARSEVAGRQASQVEAEPFAFDAAIALAEAARDGWQNVAIERPDWLAARRNAERAVLWIDELRRQRDAAQAKQPKKEPDAPRPQEAPPPAPPEELPPDQVRRLLDKLALKELEKRRLRRSRQQAMSSEVPQDW